MKTLKNGQQLGDPNADLINQNVTKAARANASGLITATDGKLAPGSMRNLQVYCSVANFDKARTFLKQKGFAEIVHSDENSYLFVRPEDVRKGEFIPAVLRRPQASPALIAGRFYIRVRPVDVEDMMLFTYTLGYSL